MKLTLLTATIAALTVIAAAAHAQTPALDANMRAMAAAAKAGDRNRMADLQHQRQALLQAQDKLSRAGDSAKRFNQPQ